MPRDGAGESASAGEARAGKSSKGQKLAKFELNLILTAAKQLKRIRTF